MKYNQALDITKRVQIKYPKIHIGGSFGLILHGVNLNRDIYDLDFCSPYDLNLKDGENGVTKTHRGTYSELHDSWFQGDDFNWNIERDGYKVQIRIDDTQTCKLINNSGFIFRVTDIEIIRMYKQKYLDKGYEKHRKDLYLIDKFLKK